MQPHEGPRQDPRNAERERRRQWILTGWLSAAIVVLAGLVTATWIWN